MMRLPRGDGSDEDTETVVVFVSGDAVELITAKVLLDGEAIPYALAGEGAQELFGMAPFNMITGPARISVRSEDASRAREVLASM